MNHNLFNIWVSKLSKQKNNIHIHGYDSRSEKCRKLSNERTVCTECNLQNFHNKNKDQAFQNSGFYISKLFFPIYHKHNQEKIEIWNIFANLFIRFQAFRQLFKVTTTLKHLCNKNTQGTLII